MEKKQISIDYPTAIARLTKFISEKVTKEKKVDTELLAILRTFIEIRNISYVNPSIKREIKQSIEQAFNSNKEIAETLTGKSIEEIDTVFIKDSHYEVTSYKPSDKEGTLQHEPKRVVVECEKKDVII
jgi:hypothetical protein|tara:strand:- start:1921 stop:2304 length:384 start_codon:yes stop_codon:yes gene_type:complete